ncbi:DUF4185 domain-containing protein [bacterium]|nr:DUF4185 domain-containing protein [bacterium]
MMRISAITILVSLFVGYLFTGYVFADAEAPYSPSDVIEDIRFAPKSEIIRLGKGGDNWPLTWADDGALYTAYGDGWGFEPKVKTKLSLGLGKVTGTPPPIKGTNIRSKSGERIGQGKHGVKASGMLMVDGVLYMLCRNADNSTLAWSSDHAETWDWAGWRFKTSFGYPTFLNFGKNYHNARDAYVYVYSHDHDSAYAYADRMVLARVHRSKIKERGAYEFFVKTTKGNQPVWSKNIKKRGAVFRNPGRCCRSGISYNYHIKRYLWCQVFQKPGTDKDERFEGGFGIYEAPQPWGPWKTAYFTADWDVGPGETSSIPVKWMQPDGTCYLVFSGDDAFSVRKLTIETK